MNYQTKLYRVKSSSCVQPAPSAGQVLCSKFRVIEQIGQGSFGTVFRVENLSNNALRALKVAKQPNSKRLLKHQYSMLQTLAGSEVVPKAYSLEQEQSNLYLEIDLYDASLEQLVQGKPVSGKAAAFVLQGLVRTLQIFHQRSLVYRDLKPANVMVKFDTPGKFYIIDLGLCKYYKSPEGDHTPLKINRSMTGTPIFASANALQRFQPSRRDDVISAIYTAMSLVKQLPWQKGGVQAIAQIKQSLSADELCEGYPQQFSTVLEYALGLSYEDEPDYDFIRGQLQRVADPRVPFWKCQSRKSMFSLRKQSTKFSYQQCYLRMLRQMKRNSAQNTEVALQPQTRAKSRQKPRAQLLRKVKMV